MNDYSQQIAGAASGFINTCLYIATATFASLLVFASYQFEVDGYSALLGTLGEYRPFHAPDLTVAEILAIGLNGGKIMLIFVIWDQARRFGGRAFAAKTLRILVLVISLLMTLLVVGGQTISPKAQANLNAGRARVESVHANIATALASDQETQLEAISDHYAGETDLVRTTHLTYLAELNKKLDKERMTGGQAFKGKRYLELEDMIANEITQFNDRMDVLRSRQLAETTKVEDSFREEIQQAKEDAKDQLSQLGFDKVFGSSEAQHPYMLRAAEMTRTFFPEYDDPIKITIAIAVILCFGIELTPMVLFAHLFRVLGGVSRKQEATDRVETKCPQPANSPGVPDVQSEDAPIMKHKSAHGSR